MRLVPQSTHVAYSNGQFAMPIQPGVNRTLCIEPELELATSNEQRLVSRRSDTMGCRGILMVRDTYIHVDFISKSTYLQSRQVAL